MSQHQHIQGRHIDGGKACPSEEEIAAFIDGRLSGAGRDRVVAGISACERCRELFYGSSQFVHQAPGGRLLAGRWSQRRVRLGAAIASVAVAAAVVLLLPPSPMVMVASDLVEPLEQGEALRSTLGEGWAVGRWSATRGGGTLLAAPATAFRLGARVVDLEVAVRAEEREVATRLVAEVEQILAEVELAEPLALAYRELGSDLAAGASWSTVASRTVAIEASLVDSIEARHTEPHGAYNTGRWTAAAHLAARTRNRSFFVSRRLRRFVDEVHAAAPPAELAVHVDRIRGLLARELGEREYLDLESAFASWVRLQGNGEVELDS